MGAVNLGTWRIAIIVALVVVGVAVLANGFDPADSAVAAPSGSPSPDTDVGDGGDGGAPETDEPAPADSPSPTPPPNKGGIAVKVFNGTDQDGLAAAVQLDLADAGGYDTPEEPENAPVADVDTTTVYFRGGQDAVQNEADATYLARKYIKPVITNMPKIDELTAQFGEDLVGDAITVVVLVGDDYAAADTAEG
jgi:hypothetical protein